jgi:hypothetical protein
MGYLTRDQAGSLRAKRAGQMRAAFWRPLGFPNLIRARARRTEMWRLREMLAHLKPLQKTSMTVPPPSAINKGQDIRNVTGR